MTGCNHRLTGLPIISCPVLSPRHCTVLYCTVLYWTVLYCSVLYCSVLYCTVLLCDPGLLTGLDWLPTHCTVQHTVQCGTALYCTVLYSAVWHCTALYYIYSAVLHCTHTPACSHFIQCCMALYSLPRMFTCHMKNKLQYSLSRMVLHWLHIASDVQNYFMTF